VAVVYEEDIQYHKKDVCRWDGVHIMQGTDDLPQADNGGYPSFARLQVDWGRYRLLRKHINNLAFMVGVGAENKPREGV
jgi:hypothetical protein